jgi:hypothetical protein
MTWVEFAAAMRALGARTEAVDIARYEAGAYWPRLPMFAALAEALGVSLDVLWYGEAEAARIARRRRRLGCPGPPER